MIKKEVNTVVKETIKYDPTNNNNTNDSIESNAKEITYLRNTIDSQNKDIEFLRNELLSKDKIIETLLNDKSNATNSRINSTEIITERSDETLQAKIVNEAIVSDDKVSNRNNINKDNEVRSNKKRSIVILGDSMLKDIDQHKVRKGLDIKAKVYVKHFSGATIHNMKSYVIPTKGYNNVLIIVHCGTNDLRSDKNSKDIANQIHDLASDLKTSTNDVMISGLVSRSDKLNIKAHEVNNYLKSLCSDNNFNFIDNSNLKINKHLNNSGLILNCDGTFTLGCNFVNACKI